MKQPIMLTIKGTQTVDGSSDVTELTTVGDMVIKNNKYYLTYKDSKTTGYEGCTTVVKVEGDHRVTMQRFGPSPSLLIMDKGHRHQCMLGTDVGKMTIGIFTHALTAQLTPHGGNVHMAYSIDINTALASENKVDIHVRLI